MPAVGERLRTRPLGLTAAALVLAEALLALTGVRWGPLAVAALVLAPGLALLPLLPEGARRRPEAALAAAPAIGIAAASIALITLASTGAALTPVTVRLAAAVPVAVGVLVSPRSRPFALSGASCSRSAGSARPCCSGS